MSNAKNSISFDVISFGLAISTVIHITWSLLELEVPSIFNILKKNPLLGGDPTIAGELPVWSYMIGHIFPGLVLQLIGSVLATIMSREWRFAPRHDLKAAVLTIVALVGSAPLLAPLHKLLYEQKIGSLYFDLDKFSMEWIFVSVLLSLAITETWFYWIHLALHEKTLYKYIHGVHHTFNPSTSACAAAFHPLDIVILTIGALIVPVLVPIHHGVYSGILLVNLFFTILQHTATRSSFGMGIVNDPNMHNIHHDYGRTPKNLGSILCLWDRIMGTYEPSPPSWVLNKQK